MKIRSFFPTILLGALSAASGAIGDTLTITKLEDIHIVNPEGKTDWAPLPCIFAPGS